MNKSIRRIELFSRILVIISFIFIVVGIFYEGIGVMRLAALIKNKAPRAEFAEYITMMAEGLAFIIHYFFVIRFLIGALLSHKPLTKNNGKELRTIGIETIVLPLIVAIINIIVYAGVRNPLEAFELEVYELVLGIFLIQTSYVIDYATEKIEAGHKYHAMCNKLKEENPKLYYQIEREIEEEE